MSEKANQDPMALLAALEGAATSEDFESLLLETRIVIQPGGQVIMENLTADMLEVAYELNPDDPGVHCRLDLGAPEEASVGAPEEASE